MILDWVGLSAQAVESNEIIEDFHGTDRNVRQNASVQPRKGLSTGTSKGKRNEPAKERQRHAGSPAARGGRNKTKAGVKV